MPGLKNSTLVITRVGASSVMGNLWRTTWGNLDVFMEATGCEKMYADGLLQFLSGPEEDVRCEGDDSNKMPLVVGGKPNLSNHWIGEHSVELVAEGVGYGAFRNR